MEVGDGIDIGPDPVNGGIDEDLRRHIAFAEGLPVKVGLHQILGASRESALVAGINKKPVFSGAAAHVAAEIDQTACFQHPAALGYLAFQFLDLIVHHVLPSFLTILSFLVIVHRRTFYLIPYLQSMDFFKYYQQDLKPMLKKYLDK
jgi:hypothetical protein